MTTEQRQRRYVEIDWSVGEGNRHSRIWGQRQAISWILDMSLARCGWHDVLKISVRDAATDLSRCILEGRRNCPRSPRVLSLLIPIVVSVKDRFLSEGFGPCCGESPSCEARRWEVWVSRRRARGNSGPVRIGTSSLARPGKAKSCASTIGSGEERDLGLSNVRSGKTIVSGGGMWDGSAFSSSRSWRAWHPADYR